MLLGVYVSCRFRPSFPLRLSSFRRNLSLKTMGAPAAQTVDTTKRLEALRQYMSQPEYNVDAVVIPSEDQRKFLHVHFFRHALRMPFLLPLNQTLVNTSHSAMKDVLSSLDSPVRQVQRHLNTI